MSMHGSLGSPSVVAPPGGGGGLPWVSWDDCLWGQSAAENTDNPVAQYSGYLLTCNGVRHINNRRGFNYYTQDCIQVTLAHERWTSPFGVSTDRWAVFNPYPGYPEPLTVMVATSPTNSYNNEPGIVTAFTQNPIQIYLGLKGGAWQTCVEAAQNMYPQPAATPLLPTPAGG
ncbi:MAG: hypothetical protein ACYCXA_12915 [Actinomycetes bacterium]